MAPEAKRDDAHNSLDNAIVVGEGSALNLDKFAVEDIEVPTDPATQSPCMIFGQFWIERSFSR